ncbi:MAG: 4Fe-4S dicluster domain-containing protein [Thermoleophilia bacterium]|nr:4Fe-4S dicluster domain-containing protein [Thermoleophilia bacterium]
MNRVEPPAGLSRFDERDNVQSRNTLEPGTSEYEDYYRRHPEYRDKDDAIRALPGMGRVGHAADVPLIDAQIGVIAALGMSDRVDGPVAPERVEMSPERATEKVKGFARHLGADLVRVGPLSPSYVYTNIGKTWHDAGRPYGQPIELTHKHAVSLAVAISPAMLKTGPVIPEAAEIMRVYTKLAGIAVALAAYIRALGYPARAHVMSNYQVLTVPVAMEAGMGGLGRHGLLITKELGSALKLATVTTDLPLLHDPPRDLGVSEFCQDCNICADTCPSGAISRGERRVVRGVEKWAINPEACFTVWNETGTDCGVCVASCPWTHPRTRFHRLMAEIASRKRKAGWWMSRAHRLVYGRFSPAPVPGWFEEPDPVWKRYRRLV